MYKNILSLVLCLCLLIGAGTFLIGVIVTPKNPSNSLSKAKWLETATIALLSVRDEVTILKEKSPTRDTIELVRIENNFGAAVYEFRNDLDNTVNDTLKRQKVIEKYQLAKKICQHSLKNFRNKLK